MFKHLKRRGEKVKEKLDFKFNFHATRVPSSGWDKLVVSVIPLETGKVSYKTTRAVTKNGACNWPDNYIETTKLLRDTKTKEYEEKLYKFIVSTGSSRSGVLGEATLNVADHTATNDQSQVALTLKNCSAGSILHVTVTCLTPRTNSGHERGRERHDQALEDGEELSGSEDTDLDDSDLSETFTTGSVTSNTSAPALSQSGSVQQKDGYLRGSTDSLDPSTPKQNGNPRAFASDTVSSSPTSSMNSSGRHVERVGTSLASQDSYNSQNSLPPGYARGGLNGSSSGVAPQSNRSYNEREWQSQRSTGSRSVSDNGSKPNSQTNLGGREALQADLVAAEKTIEELRVETVATQRLNRKLSIEIENLKQQLNTQIRNGTESGMEMSTLIAERDRLRQELEQVRSSKMALEEKESGDGNSRWQVENAQRTIRELQEEVRYYKEENVNLNVQVRKMQDSNMEFVLAIKDIEDQLEQIKKENEDLAEENERLQDSLDHKQRDSLDSLADLEQDWKQKLASVEEDRKSLESKLLALENHQVPSSKPGDEQRIRSLEKMVERLTQDVEDLEKESKELADENVQLYTTLEQAKREHPKGESNSSLPSASEGAEVARLKRLVAELEDKVASVEDNQHKLHTQDRHIPDTESVNKHNSQLEQSLSKASKALDDRQQEISALEDRCSRAEEERSIYLEKIEGLDDDMSRLKEEIRNIMDSKMTAESTISRLNREKEELEERLRGAATETGEAAEQIQEREAEMAQMQRRNVSQAAKVKELEECLLELDAEKAALERNLRNLAESESLSKSRIEELESQLSELSDTVESINRSKLETEERISQLERARSKLELENQELITKLQARDVEKTRQEEQLAMNRSDELMALREEKDSFTNSKRNLERRASELESIKDDLETQLVELEKENFGLGRRVTELETQLKHAIEEQGAFESDKIALERKLEAVQGQKSREAEEALLEATREHQLKVSELEAQLVALRQEKQATAMLQQELEKQVERQEEEAAEYMDTIHRLKERISQLEKVQVDLEAKSQQDAQEYSAALKTISSLEEQLSLLQTQNEVRTKQLLAEIETLKEQNDAAEQMKAQDVEMLSIELQRAKNAFEKVKGERDTADASAKGIKELNEYLQEEKSQMEEDINAWEQENEDLKLSITALEQKIAQLELQLEENQRASSHTQDSDLRSESLELRRQNIEFKQQLSEQEEEKEEFRRRAQSLEIEIQEKLEALRTVERKYREKDFEDCSSPRSNGGGSPKFLQRSLSRSNSKNSPINTLLSREARELQDLKDKVKLLEGEVKSKAMAMDDLKREFSVKEAKLLEKIESLEVANEQLIQGGADMGMEYLQVELQRLQSQNSTLARRERELVSQLSAQDVLHKEVQRLQEVLCIENEQLESRFCKFKETAKFGNLMDRVVTLETELAEANEANAMYKMQLQNAFAKQDNVQAAALQQYGEVDQIITDLVRLKGHSSKLEGDVKDLRERYATMSLRYAEVEAQREELVMTLSTKFMFAGPISPYNRMTGSCFLLAI
ncbi:hypothetical protein R1flu_014458 [Riccia fluitans]|uniref:C2 NT-type domain-containing protein n=1 Tax=Riccia fluitans TaxID=41844 RepID=A0ABD1YJA5_9MARC